MLRIVTLLIIIILPLNSYGTDFSIQGEYKKDIIDFDEKEKELYKVKSSILLSENSSFNFAYINNITDKEMRHTWNLMLFDINKFFQIILGNYNINFATGLFIGKKKYPSPDIFSKKETASFDNSIKPDNSGNGQYSFFGTAMKMNTSIFKKKIIINSFISRKKRFIDSDSYDSCIIKSTIGTVNSKIIASPKNNEPVIINDIGTMVDIFLSKFIELQLYYFDTHITNLSDKNIIWNYNDNGYSSSYGINKYYSIGGFAQYSDNYITLFSEYGRGYKKINFEDKKNKTESDYGFLYGFKFKHPLFKISVIGKNTGEKFYTPYGSTGSHGEDSWQFDFSVKASKKLTLGTGLESERRLAASTNSNNLPVIQKESLYSRYKFSKNFSYNFKIKSIKSDKNDIEKKIQIKNNLQLKLFKILIFKLSGIYQKKEEVYSYGYNSILKSRLFHYFNITLSFAQYITENDNPIYAQLSDDSRKVRSEFYISEKINVSSFKFSFKYKKNSFSGKYQIEFYDGEIFRRKFEYSGKIYF